DIDRCLSQFYEGFALPEFEPDRQRFPTEPELVSYLVRQLVGYGQEDYAKYQTGDKEADVSNLLCDRQLYVDNYQTHLRYVLSIAFSLKAETITAFVADLKAKMENNPFELLMLISSADALAEYLKPFLDADGVNYDADKLLAAANAVVGFIMGPGSILLAFAVSGLDRFKRLFAMHMPETNYALLAY
ncbi:MAG: hypothetical protein K6E59_00360, partial [Bacilli bacterium]|nr:hypothetical protein [Bacilli bacterium]